MAPLARQRQSMVSQLSFLVLLEMVRVADDLHERVKKIRAESMAVERNTPTTGLEEARPFREREPWINKNTKNGCLVGSVSVKKHQSWSVQKIM